MAADNSTVRNNSAANRFEIDTAAGMAVADYRRSADTLIIYHTEVPEAQRGRGIGETLVLGALEHIRDQNLKVVARCWFVGDVLARHPEYQSLEVAR